METGVLIRKKKGLLFFVVGVCVLIIGWFDNLLA